MSVKGSLKNSYPSDFQARRNRKALKSIVKKIRTITALLAKPKSTHLIIKATLRE